VDSLNAARQPESDRLLPGTRFALGIGFGVLLIIMALAGIDALRVLRQIRRENDRIRTEFLFRNHALNDIRNQLHVSGTYVREYLLEPRPARAETFRSNIEKVHHEMQSSLEAYRAQLRPEEQLPYREMTAELWQYWKEVSPVLQWDAEERRARGYAFLRDVVFPRREAMLETTGRIADANERQVNAGSDRIVALLLAFQLRLAVTLAATLGLGLGMAAFTTLKILKLQASANAHYRAVSEAREQLKDLSARLVQAQETERRGLSRELHDEVGQSLSAVLVELGNLSARMDNRAEEQSREQVDLIKGLVESTVRTVRNMSLLLRPSMLDDLGLVPALRWQAREVSKRTSMDVSVAAEGVPDSLPDEYKTCVYRVVQEALHNCSSHSNATTVRVRVQQEGDRLSLSIQDDGRGFDVQQTKGLGLLGIEERVARLGGKFQVHSAPGSGAILTAELPLKHVLIEQPDQTDRSNEKLEADSHSVGR
jgi:signal transduction histidine kinase